MKEVSIVTDLPSSSEEGIVNVNAGGASLSPPSLIERLLAGTTSGEVLSPLDFFFTESRCVWIISFIFTQGLLCSLFGDGEVELSS